MASFDFQQFASPQTLMVQGTTSDAGKSVFVAGLCRLLAKHQLSVAPFKPQNMALNSAVTIDGGEIGRSQALQAQACKLKAHTDFNPVLLKPSSDTGAQVIIHGKAINAMQAQEFHDYKRFAMQAVLESHSRLQNQYDHIIVEGAGSPAEINLRKNDIANMGFAESVDCPVILIADIDRGGVFAHLVGTLDLLSQSEQDRVIGFVINRFRGDIKLLESGLDWLEERTGKPVLGVLPYLKNFYLDAEDAICSDQVFSTNKQFKVVVPVLPRIGNHTDFDALRLHPDVDLQFVHAEQGCPPGDLIVLPGSKNTRADLETLKKAGWQEHIDKHLRYGGKVIGVCGGYQMLGKYIHDPDGIEGSAGSSSGFGLLDIETTFEKEKILSHVNATFCHPDFKQTSIKGYEIHCGITKLSEPQQNNILLQVEHSTHSKTAEFDGAYSSDNKVIGTYLHGLFDQAESTNALLKWAGLDLATGVDLDNIREQQLNRLSETLEKNLNPAFIHSLMNNRDHRKKAT